MYRQWSYVFVALTHLYTDHIVGIIWNSATQHQEPGTAVFISDGTLKWIFHHFTLLYLELLWSMGYWTALWLIIMPAYKDKRYQSCSCFFYNGTYLCIFILCNPKSRPKTETVLWTQPPNHIYNFYDICWVVGLISLMVYCYWYRPQFG